jgi:UDP-N-acetylglucosamine transferase subunit ALG13
LFDESAKASSRPLLCLAASGGGHVRQVLDLEPLWRDYAHFFVTEDTALGRSIAARSDTEFVPHFALGQARLGHPLTMLAAAWASLRRSFAIVRRRRPDVVITTGAGSQLFIVLWARLRGAKIILIDSFARFDSPSAFARLAGPLAHARFAQSAVSGAKWPGAQVCDPLRLLDTPRPRKRALLFATVGATLPFERLTQLVIEAKRAGAIFEEVVLQVGQGAAQIPPVEGIRIVDELSFDEIQALLVEADFVVCHGGTGSIITATKQRCRVIVIPRRFELGEHYDNHQEEICSAFEQRGLVLAAQDSASFVDALQRARAMEPKAATTDYAELIMALRALLPPAGTPA